MDPIAELCMLLKGKGGKGEGGGCWTCGSTYHQQRDCPNKGKGKGQFGGFRGGGKWGKGFKGGEGTKGGKGKGFQGVYRKFNFGGLPQSHGSMMHRRPGSIGAGSTPGRVWKNTKMPGRMGGKKVTVQNLKVIQSRPSDNVLLISGAVPGAKGGYVIIRPALKK